MAAVATESPPSAWPCRYEKARELKKHIGKVRADYTQGMASGNLEAQQRSVAVYLIDRLALRVGGEKDTGEEAVGQTWTECEPSAAP